MNLLANWREVLLRAWSIRWVIAAFLFNALAFGLPHVHPDQPIPPELLQAIAGLCDAGAFVSRLLAQKELTEEADGQA